MADKPREYRSVSTNKKARFSFEVLEELECGVVLKGTEMRIAEALFSRLRTLLGTWTGPSRRSETLAPPAYEIPVGMDGMPYHQPHLANFFDAVRGKGKLNCPAEIGYETAVMVLKVNEAVEAQKRLTFEKGEFHV